MKETFPNPGQYPINETQAPLSQEEFLAFEKEIGSKLYTASNSVYLCNQVDNLIKENYSPLSLKKMLEFCKENPETHSEFTYQIERAIEFLESPDMPEEKKEQTRSLLQKSLSAFSAATKKLSKVIFLRALPAYAAYFIAVNVAQKPDGKYEDRERAKIELETKGITSEQASVYKLGMSEMIYRGVVPFGYPQASSDSKYLTNHYLRHLPQNLLFGREESGVVSTEDFGEISTKPSDAPAAEDAWRFYLGLPQAHNTLGISDYKPTNAKENKFYYKVNNFSYAFLAQRMESNINYLSELKGNYNTLTEMFNGDKEKVFDYAKTHLDKNMFNDFVVLVEKGEKSFVNKSLLSYVDELKKQGGKRIEQAPLFQDNSLPADTALRSQYDTRDFKASDILNNYTVSLGKDEKGNYISYYDVYDLNAPTEKSGKGIGRPFEIYDRIYYNPQNGEIIDSPSN